MTIGIYSIRNKINGKQYIGKSINIESRWAQHRCDMRREERSKDFNRHLYNSAKKHGIDNFEFLILEEFEDVDEGLISEAELKWMLELNTLDRSYGYNLRADSSTKMIVHEETRKLRSESSMGANNPNYGNYWTDEQKLQMSQTRKERIDSGEIQYTQEWRDKISKNSSEMWKDESKKDKMRKEVSKSTASYFVQMTKDYELINVWKSIQQVLHYNPEYKWQNIYAACNGNKKSYMGFIWKRYKQGELPEEYQYCVDNREFEIEKRSNNKETKKLSSNILKEETLDTGKVKT